MTIKTAVFPVGGLGTRFLPATKSMPKEMLPVFGKPIIQHAFEEAKAAGVEKFIFVTGRNKNAINNHFDKAYELENSLNETQKISEINKVSGWLSKAGSISFIRQGEPLGLGHAIYCAKNFVNEPFIVILADEMVLEQRQSNLLKNMITQYNKNAQNSNVISVAKVEKKDVHKYGIISAKEEKITDMVEKPNQNEAPSDLAINGRYILQPEIFSFLEKQKTGKNGELQLTDAMKSMIKHNHNFYYSLFEEDRFDCGNPLGYLEANIAYAKKYADKPQEISKILKKWLFQNNCVN